MALGIKEKLRKQDGSYPPKVRTLMVHKEKYLKILNISIKKNSIDMKLHRVVRHDEIRIMNGKTYAGLNIRRNNKSK